jgi:hypothetical protein
VAPAHRTHGSIFQLTAANSTTTNGNPFCRPSTQQPGPKVRGLSDPRPVQTLNKPHNCQTQLSSCRYRQTPAVYHKGQVRVAKSPLTTTETASLQLRSEVTQGRCRAPTDPRWQGAAVDAPHPHYNVTLHIHIVAPLRRQGTAQPRLTCLRRHAEAGFSAQWRPGSCLGFPYPHVSQSAVRPTACTRQQTQEKFAGPYLVP